MKLHQDADVFVEQRMKNSLIESGKQRDRKVSTGCLRFCGCTYLVSNGFFGGKAEGADLRELSSQVIVECSELCITPIDIPLIVQDPDVHLKHGIRNEYMSQIVIQ